ncbi:MAG: hypothetical protein CL489_08510 [Acidobacteria bacterium]|nr:hypothetical protein [Acidobacteriota bacterium]|tara:strand:- start:46310 stop:46711 length:402 start_codon:yes stop_codon:yes gene_type:complete
MKKEQVDQMSLTEAVNYALGKIIEQGKPCRNPDNGYCAYSDGNGNHCVVGWLLDHENEELMKWDGGVSSLSETYKERLPKLIIDNVELFYHLQGLHDYDSLAKVDFDIDVIKNCVDINEELLNKWLAIKERNW